MCEVQLNRNWIMLQGNDPKHTTTHYIIEWMSRNSDFTLDDLKQAGHSRIPEFKLFFKEERAKT